PSTIASKPSVQCATTARSPTSWIERGAAGVAIEPTTREEARSTTASRDSSSHVTSATGGWATAAPASAACNPNGAAAATATDSRRVIDTHQHGKATLRPPHDTPPSVERRAPPTSHTENRTATPPPK